VNELPLAGRLDVADDLLAERGALLDLLRGLDSDGWERRTECPAWTVRGLALHILGDDFSLLSRQRDAATNGLLLYAESHPGLDIRGLLDGFNEQWVTAAGFFSTELVVELLRLTGEWTHRYYAEVDPDEPGEPVFFFAATGPSPVWQAAAREYVERWVHQHQIRRAVGAPDLSPQLHRACAATVARAVAAQLAPLVVPVGTTVVFAIDDVGNWTMLRTDGGWNVHDGAAREPHVVVRWSSAEAVREMSEAGFPTERPIALISQALEVMRA
jgi:uncharacterized protein (TIGR03083 family)